MSKQGFSLRAVDQRRLCHAIEQNRCERQQSLAPERFRGRHPVLDSALDPPNGLETADVRDIRGLARPRRDRSRPRHDEQLPGVAFCRRRVDPRSVGEQALENGELRRREGALEVDEMDEARIQGADGRLDGGQSSDELGDAEGG